MKIITAIFLREKFKLKNKLKIKNKYIYKELNAKKTCSFNNNNNTDIYQKDNLMQVFFFSNIFDNTFKGKVNCTLMYMNWIYTNQ